MYWLFPYELQEGVRKQIKDLVTELVEEEPDTRQPHARYLIFSGRKAQNIAHIIIDHLSEDGELIVDPFLGSGTFLYSAMSHSRHFVGGDLDPYISRMVYDLIRGRDSDAFDKMFSQLQQELQPFMDYLYQTHCSCGYEMAVKAVYFDFEPLEYINPTPHERIHEGGKNVVLTHRGQFYSRNALCPRCGTPRKQFDEEDLFHLEELEQIDVSSFPNHELIENSRINITANRSLRYGFFFTHRAKLALIKLWNAIQQLPSGHEQCLMKDAFLATLHLVTITDYRSKSQDLYHVPPVQCKENNVWWQFQARVHNLRKAQGYLASVFGCESNKLNTLESSLKGILSKQDLDKKWALKRADFRTTMQAIPAEACGLVITDPPYTDQVPHLERHQLYYPWLEAGLTGEMLKQEVVITNAPSRADKRDRAQYFRDIDRFFAEAARILRQHRYLVIYFHPAKKHWAEDLNWFKLLARKHGLEPIQNVDISRKDPTVRKQASAAWEFNDDIVLIYIKLAPNERYWFEGNNSIDKLVYEAAVETVETVGGAFSLQQLHDRLYRLFQQRNLLYLTKPEYSVRIRETLQRYCEYSQGLYSLKQGGPFEHINSKRSVAQRIQDFTPLVIEELLQVDDSFTYPDFLLRLSQYLDNGERELIEELERDERLIEITLATYVQENESGALVRKPEFDISIYGDDGTRTNLFEVDPTAFEHLIRRLLKAEGFTHLQVVGRTDDRGIDVTGVSPRGEMFFIQVKRWKYNVSATPIQRVHSASLTRGGDGSWVITTSDFTQSARDEAKSYTGTILTNGTELMRLLEAHFPGRFRLGTD